MSSDKFPRLWGTLIMLIKFAEFAAVCQNKIMNILYFSYAIAKVSTKSMMSIKTALCLPLGLAAI